MLTRWRSFGFQNEPFSSRALVCTCDWRYDFTTSATYEFCKNWIHLERGKKKCLQTFRWTNNAWEGGEAATVIYRCSRIIFIYSAISFRRYRDCSEMAVKPYISTKRDPVSRWRSSRFRLYRAITETNVTITRVRLESGT